MHRWSRVNNWFRVMPGFGAVVLAVLLGVGLTQAPAAERGFLGVMIQPLTADLAKGFGLSPSTGGVMVSGVRDGSPAAKAGIKAGDVIVEFDGKPVTQPRELSERVAATPTGKAVTVKLIRNNQEVTVSAMTAGMESKEESVQAREPEMPKTGKFGLALQAMTPELAKELDSPQTQGLVVQAVRQGSLADQAGIRRGDVITEVNRQPLKTADELRTALEQATSEKPTVLLVHRRGGALYLTVKG